MRRFARLPAFLLLLALGSPASLLAQQKRPLTLDDYGPWSRITQVTLSPDGRWLAYVLQPNDGDATLHLKQLDGKGVHQATNGLGPAFSDDGRWAAFLTLPPKKDADQLRKQKKPVPQTLHLVDLQRGDTLTEPGVRAFSFSKGGRFLGIHRERTDPILQWSQGRMGDQPWDHPERWRSQSPIEHVPDISTPFLILQGTADGAVDWNQGLELYTAARRPGKDVIFLSYPDEPHHLSKEANQKDFQIRMKQFFDHWLMGAPAPEWMTRGVPFLDKGRVGPEGKVIS